VLKVVHDSKRQLNKRLWAGEPKWEADGGQTIVFPNWHRMHLNSFRAVDTGDLGDMWGEGAWV